MNDVHRMLADLVERGMLVRHEPAGEVTYGFDDDVARKIAEWMAAHPDERGGLREEQVSTSLGGLYASRFESFADAGTLEADEQAALEARQALQSYLAAQAFDELDDLGSKLVTGSRDPELLGQVIDEFTVAGVPITFADYRVRRLIGAGTQAAVYEAERADNGLPVAVKVLRGAWSSDDADVLRFLDEARLANRVRHPNAVEVFDAGHTRGSRFLVMELLRGRSLERRWRAKGRRLPLRRVLEITMHVLGVLAAAHEKSIIHGGIKPSNIFLASDGGVKVLDFGIEGLMRAAPPPRRRFPDEPEPPSFLAPEQLRGELPDPRTDLWSVGSTMLALLSGAPADPNRPLPIMSAMPDVPQPVVAVIERALRPSRDERWQTATQMWEAIAAIHTELNEREETISDPGNATAPLVETDPAGPLSERVSLSATAEGRSRSLRPAAGEPAPAQSAPPEAEPIDEEPPPSGPPPSGPPAVLPIELPLEMPPSKPVPSRVRAVASQEAHRYVVPVRKRAFRWSPLLLIGLPVLVTATVMTAVWFAISDRLLQNGNPPITTSGQPTVTGPVVSRQPCSDGIKNGAETDVDCGGGQCAPCGVRGACRAATDCRTAVCAGGVCAACTKPSDCPRGMVCGVAGSCVWPVASFADAGTPSLPGDAGGPADAGEPPRATGPKKNADKCEAGGECQSGYCVDGVCCDGPCTGTCLACDLRSFMGMCAEIPYGYDPDKECTPKVCDGDGACGERKIAGKRCKAGRECKSGFCWRGICCNTECRGADGNCSTGTCKRSLLIE